MFALPLTCSLTAVDHASAKFRTTMCSGRDIPNHSRIISFELILQSRRRMLALYQAVLCHEMAYHAA